MGQIILDIFKALAAGTIFLLILGLIMGESPKKQYANSEKQNEKESFENIINHMKYINSKKKLKNQVGAKYIQLPNLILQ